ncbi:signal peptidase I [Vibrio cholerae]|nr:signal peptidase I [Vibrio cholerae]
MARSFRRKSPPGAASSPTTQAFDPDADAPVVSGDEPQDRPRDRREPDRGFGAWLKEIATIVVIALVLSFLIKTFLFRAFFIPSGSMEETLEIDDRIFVNQLVPQPFDLQRGDIVVFRDTEGWLPEQVEQQVSWLKEALIFIGLAPDESQQHLVKRVIGLPGDHVICCDAQGRITVNGEPLEEPYLFPGATPSDLPFDVVVPDGKIWVMGDHRNASADSRANQDKPGKGFVDVDDIEGKAAVIAWPLNRVGFLGNHPEVFDGVPDPETAGQPEPAGS